jgi:Methyltransferase small domain
MMFDAAAHRHLATDLHPKRGMSHFIDGPIGRFEIPESPPATRNVCEGIARNIWAGEYSHPELPSKIKRILDIGAGWGAFAAWAQSVWPDAQIDCYEPHAAACEYLRRNVPKARVHQVAVTVQERAFLSCGPYDHLENWGARTVFGITSGTEVATLHPSKLPAADLPKIDAEGVEPEFVENWPHMAGASAFLYEFHNADHRKRLRELSSAAGFRCLREVQSGGHTPFVIWGPSVWVRDEVSR